MKHRKAGRNLKELYNVYNTFNFEYNEITE
jgi:hypothetical protein